MTNERILVETRKRPAASNISATRAEQLDSTLESVDATGKMSWAEATRFMRECKMRFERIKAAGAIHGSASSSAGVCV